MSGHYAVRYQEVWEVTAGAAGEQAACTGRLVEQCDSVRNKEREKGNEVKSLFSNANKRDR